MQNGKLKRKEKKDVYTVTDIHIIKHIQMSIITCAINRELIAYVTSPPTPEGLI